MKINEALDKLYSMHKFGVKLGLENITKLLDYLGNPQNKFKSIHIAGSNGKGSTASFIASIIRESGKNVGLYTSPHFIRFNERIRINGNEIPDTYIAEFITTLNDYIDKHKPTFFEITTALAFKYFADNEIDIGVIETGLGGRLDATNTINPLASVITTISYEHTNILGESLVEIAREKAGIIKESTPLFLGKINIESKEAITSIAKQRNSKIFDLLEFIDPDRDYIPFSSDKLNFNIYSTPLRGKHQLYNSALALLVVSEVLGIRTPDVLRKGISNVARNSGLQGRYEIYSDKPRIIFDAAHNEEGVEIFLSEFANEEKNYECCNVIFGAMIDKNIHSMLKKLNEHFDNIYVTSINYERAATVDDLKSSANSLNIKVIPIQNPAIFIKEFKAKKNNQCLCVLGSIYILGDIKDKLLKLT